MLDNILTTVISVSFWSYWLYVLIKYGVRPSISESFYSHKERNDKPFTPRLLFLFMIFGVAMPLLFIIPTWYGMVSSGLLMLIGVAADFRANKSTLRAHVFASYTGIVGALASIGAYYGGWNWIFLLLFLVGAGYMTFAKKDVLDIDENGVREYKTVDVVPNKTWWIETYALSLGIIALYIN